MLFDTSQYNIAWLQNVLHRCSNGEARGPCLPLPILILNPSTFLGWVQNNTDELEPKMLISYFHFA